MRGGPHHHEHRLEFQMIPMVHDILATGEWAFTMEWAMDRSANITTVTQPAGVIILDKGMLNREVRLNEAGPMRSFGFKGGKVRVEFDTQLGETYLLEYSASLGSPEWQLLGTRQGTGRAEVFEVPAGGGSGGFFRMLNR